MQPVLYGDLGTVLYVYRCAVLVVLVVVVVVVVYLMLLLLFT